MEDNDSGQIGDADRALVNGASEAVSTLRASIPSAEEVGKLFQLHRASSAGPWVVQSGLMGGSLYVTSHMRESEFRGDDREGPICYVSTERTITSKRGYRSEEYSFRKEPIKTARADAELIVAAVNALPKLLNALASTGRFDETAWLIEWPANKHNPLRYFAAGEQAVMSANDATRFSRKKDAEATMRAEKHVGAHVVEHKWIMPASAIEARRAETAVAK